MLAFKLAVLFVVYSLSWKTAIADEPTTAASLATDHTFSVLSSNAPDPQYEWDAVTCLSEAYLLHPNSIETVAAAFTELYQLKHKGTWTVNVGCGGDHVFVAHKNYIKIEIKATSENDETVITLFN